VGEVAGEGRGGRVRESLLTKLHMISVRTSQMTQFVSISKINSLILFIGKVVIYPKDHT
jgi:hypothetical protein